MQNEPKYELINLEPSELKLISEEVDAVLKKYSAQFVVSPAINPNGTLAAKLDVFKRVELVPKAIPSPYAGGPEQPSPEAEVA